MSCQKPSIMKIHLYLSLIMKSFKGTSCCNPFTNTETSYIQEENFKRSVSVAHNYSGCYQKIGNRAEFPLSYFILKPWQTIQKEP
ncbi:unnamed protein product [Moneuplotes crassus]|uniref:Uncharacterized protein n=1 Tax=Euplotes crassus TaxID=5936 RepID=A0AAD1UB21_EUPCR|nr:unnamed protein product [Moneuplotes crassus]